MIISAAYGIRITYFSPTTTEPGSFELRIHLIGGYRFPIGAPVRRVNKRNYNAIAGRSRGCPKRDIPLKTTLTFRTGLEEKKMHEAIKTESAAATPLREDTAISCQHGILPADIAHHTH